MKRTHVHRTPVLACTAALVSMVWFLPAAYAQSVQLYGTADVAVGQLANQNPGAPTTGVTEIRGVHSGALQTSYIGFRGSESLGGGWTAKFQLESFLRYDLGTPGRFDASPTGGADGFWSRESYVGLAGPVGEVRLGTNGNPAWVTLIQSSPLGANSVFSPAFRQLYNGGTRGRSVIDTSMPNSVRYLSPVFAGFSFNAALQAGEGRGTGYNYAAAVRYASGPLQLTAAVQDAEHQPGPANATAAKQELKIVGAAWNFGFMRLMATYTTVQNVGNKSKLPQFGVTVPLAGGTVQFATQTDENTVAASGARTERKTTTGGYVYPLSKRTDLYGFLMREEFPVVGPAAKEGDSYVVGIRHQF